MRLKVSFSSVSKSSNGSFSEIPGFVPISDTGKAPSVGGLNPVAASFEALEAVQLDIGSRSKVL
jgi:hypothetical protein